MGFDLVGFAYGRLRIDTVYIDLSDLSTLVALESGDNLLVNPSTTPAYKMTRIVKEKKRIQSITTAWADGARLYTFVCVTYYKTRSVVFCLLLRHISKVFLR